jgi:hypothetical protein
VQVLDVSIEADCRIRVGEGEELHPERGLELFRVVAGLLGCGFQTEHLQGLRSSVARMRACLAQCSFDLLKPLRAAVDAFDLELPKTGDDTPSLEHRDRVDDHVGERLRLARHANPFATRAEGRYGRERCRSQNADQEAGELFRRSGRRAGNLELQPVLTLRQFQLPQRLAVLGAPPKSDTDPSQAEVGRVVVGRGEEARLKLRPNELGELEVGFDHELQLVFFGGLDSRGGHGAMLAGAVDLRVGVHRAFSNSGRFGSVTVRSRLGRRPLRPAAPGLRLRRVIGSRKGGMCAVT